MLGESHSMALKQFHSLKNRFNKNFYLKHKYSVVLSKYKKLQHMSLSSNSDTRSGFYLSYHAVIKTDSTPTKTQVVFDVSSKTSETKMLLVYITALKRANLFFKRFLITPIQQTRTMKI